MAESTRNNFTPEQKKIFSNLVDMFDGFVPVSTIKETVRRNNYNLDRSLADLLQIAESGSQSSTPAKESQGNTSKNQRGPPIYKQNSAPAPNKTSQPLFHKFNHVVEDNSKGAKRKQKTDSRPKVQMPYSSQPPGNSGYSDFRKNANFYQGSPLQYQSAQRPEKMPNAQRAPNSYGYFAKNPRHGAPIIQPSPMPPHAVYAQAPNSFSNSCPPSPSHFVSNQNPPKDPKEVEIAKTYDKVYRIVNDGYKIMVLMRGCPGSGKSHAANEIIQTLFGKTVDPKNHIFSADDYFINAYGVYNFNPEYLRDAHQTTQTKVLAALKSGITPVIIDNTNTQAWEMKIYVSMAVAWGYYLEVLEPLTSWKFEVKTLTRKGIHNIPLYKVRDMLERYERDITGKKLLELNASAYPPNLTPPQLASNSPKKKFYDSLSTTNNVAKVEKVEKAVNKNISEIMQSFFKNNPCKPAQNQTNGPVSQNHERQSNWKNVSNNPMRREVSMEFLYSPRKHVFGSVENLTRSLSQTHLTENQMHVASKQVKKPKKPRKRKKPRSKIPDFSKDYVLIIEDKLVYQRDYSIYNTSNETGISSVKESDTNPSETSREERVLSISPVASKNLTPSRSQSSLAIGRSNSVCSISSNMTGLVAYSDSESSDSEDVIELYSEDLSDNEDATEAIAGINHNAEVKCSTVVKDSLTAELREDESRSSSILPSEEMKEFGGLSDDSDFMETWEQSQKEAKNSSPNDSVNPKPARNRVISPASPTPDLNREYRIKGTSPSRSNPPEQESVSAENNLGWGTEADMQSVLNSWEKANEEVTPENMVERFLKNLKEPSDPTVASSKVKNDNCSDMATLTDYEQVCAALQGSSSDYQIVECCSRDINAGLTPNPKIELQQRLHLDKGSMTEDCIPIVESSSVDINVLSKVFSPEVSESIAGLIDYCKGDINEVISSLIDSGHEITPEQFEILASIPQNSEDVSPNAELKVLSKKETKVQKVATELPKQKIKQPPSKEALKLKEEFESKFKMNPESYPKFTQQLKRQRELKQEFPSISETMKTPAPDESLVFVLDKNLIDQLQTKFGSIDLPYIKDFNPIVQIPSSLAFQLYGCILTAAEENVSQQERLMQEIIASDRKLAKQLHDSEVQQNLKTELVDIMDMKLALQLYNADLKTLKTIGMEEETVANILSRRLLEEMFPNLDHDTLSALYRINNCSFHDTVQMVVERYHLDEAPLSPDLAAQKNEFLVEPPSPEPKAEEPYEESSDTIDDYKDELSYHYQMRTKCFNQAREAYNSGKSQVASYFSQMAFLHKQKMEKASAHIIKLEIDNNLTDTLDLHFFATKDALLALDIFLDNHIKILRSQNTPAKVLYFITGRGTHSSGGVPKVKPAVMKRLQRRNIVYKHIESNPGLLSANVHKHLKLSSHFYEESL